MGSGHFTESQIIEIGYQIVVALEFCHSKNLLHQDMKPMNGKRAGAHVS
jgi:serine/threonine protein kinase